MDTNLWNQMSAGVLRQRAASGAPVLLPVGATEQHGPHLPTGVDDFLAAEACRRTAALMAERGRPVVVAPSVWCGLSEHHMGFGGTFTLSLPTYHALLRDLCGSVRRAGFRRLLIVNGHGGNVLALGAIGHELSRELDLDIAVTSYFTAAEGRIAEILESRDTLMHACEGETSMMMAAYPDLVDHARIAEATGPDISLQSRPDHFVQQSRPFDAVTPTGVAGDARPATSAKGNAMLDACAAAMADWLIQWGSPTDDHGGTTTTRETSVRAGSAS
ncbi:creatininase family protein [Actinomadura opuntiae]|uniref:creatininase family protein n=1 Tax=Actinomadura sp. OS1-43 TaxID=604315 RepID=UPI00255A891B|nr:creatininase family protein [Actinomadura sp. OS1-43]MDL4816571.1 creatininase family protein [Actinomadura sp. OS1-43]